MYILYVLPDPAAHDIYAAAALAYVGKPYADRDAGFDLYCGAADIDADGRKMIPQQVKAAFWDADKNLFRAFWLLPRSSISKTPLRMANSVGLIDAGYRGQIMGAVHNTSVHGTDAFSVKGGDRYFQLASPDLLPWDDIRVVAEIPGGATLRGVGGFGSTGTGVGVGVGFT